ncbi:hypothetical protein ACSSS7_006443 [Eimeria intestinalis]
MRENREATGVRAEDVRQRLRAAMTLMEQQEQQQQQHQLQEQRQRQQQEEQQVQQEEQQQQQQQQAMDASEQTAFEALELLLLLREQRREQLHALQQQSPKILATLNRYLTADALNETLYLKKHKPPLQVPASVNTAATAAGATAAAAPAAEAASEGKPKAQMSGNMHNREETETNDSCGCLPTPSQKPEKNEPEAPRDRNRRPLSGCWTTPRVMAAVRDYTAACTAAADDVKRALEGLSAKLQPLLPSVIHAAHLTSILQAANHHASFASSSGWTLPELLREGDMNLRVRDLTPYYLPRPPPTQPQEQKHRKQQHQQHEEQQQQQLQQQDQQQQEQQQQEQQQQRQEPQQPQQQQQQQQEQQQQQGSCLANISSTCSARLSDDQQRTRTSLAVTPTTSDELKVGDERREARFSPCLTSTFSFDLDGLIVLTGANMAGKSTLCRSALALALLANAGLFCPCGPGTRVPRYSSFLSSSYLSHDSPLENKSFFLHEAQQLKAVLDRTAESASPSNEHATQHTHEALPALVSQQVEEGGLLQQQLQRQLQQHDQRLLLGEEGEADPQPIHQAATGLTAESTTAFAAAAASAADVAAPPSTAAPLTTPRPAPAPAAMPAAAVAGTIPAQVAPATPEAAEAAAAPAAEAAAAMPLAAAAGAANAGSLYSSSPVQENAPRSTSFLILDEPCKGTAPNCGAALLGSVLESLAALKARGIVSTHLHQQLEALPLRLPPGTISFKHMRIKRRTPTITTASCNSNSNSNSSSSSSSSSSSDSTGWQKGEEPEDTSVLGPIEEEDVEYELADGVCRHSNAMHAARRAGLPGPLIRRAEALREMLPGSPPKTSALKTQQQQEQQEQQQQQEQQHQMLQQQPLESSTGRGEAVGSVVGLDAEVQRRAASALLLQQKLNDLKQLLVEVSVQLEHQLEPKSSDSSSSSSSKPHDLLLLPPQPQQLDPPPSWTGAACVYILLALRRLPPRQNSDKQQLLQLYPSQGAPPRCSDMGPHPSKGASSLVGSFLVYVGESENVKERLRQHRRKPQWGPAHALVLRAACKGHARLIETQVIRLLSRDPQLHLLSMKDGNRGAASEAAARGYVRQQQEQLLGLGNDYRPVPLSASLEQ